MLATALPARFNHLIDDTEESVVGSSLHQDAIVQLYVSLQLASHQEWLIGNQLALVILREGVPPYRPMSDIFVHRTAPPAHRTSLPIAIDGPPALIIEIASPSTVQNDLNLRAGKAGVYAAIGVAEYLVFDPTGEELGTLVWARRNGPGGFVPWEPDANGHWDSTILGVSFAPVGALLRVYDRNGALVPLATEQAVLLAQRDRQIAESVRPNTSREQAIRPPAPLGAGAHNPAQGIEHLAQRIILLRRVFRHRAQIWHH
jgi:Uma2 family endonuclease